MENDVMIPFTPAAKVPKLWEFTHMKNPTTGVSVQIIDTIQAYWPRLVNLLWLPSHTVAKLKAQPNFTPEDACREAFNIWLKGDDTLLMPRNWDTVIKVMGLLGNAKLGQDIKQVLMGMLYEMLSLKLNRSLQVIV